jgi:hypothetical protein
MSKKVFDIPVENCIKNIEVFWQILANVELLQQSWTFSKASGSLTFVLQYNNLALYHCANSSTAALILQHQGGQKVRRLFSQCGETSGFTTSFVS